MNLDNKLRKILERIHEDVNYPQNECIERLSEYELCTNALLEEYKTLDYAGKQGAAEKLSVESAWLLVAHSENIATYVMNNPSEGYLLKTVLTALSLAEKRLDFREILIILSLVFDSAGRAGVDLLSLADGEERTVLKLHEFDSRPPHDKDITAMGYVLKYRDGKPYYFRTW